jgi:hypothetical protein
MVVVNPENLVALQRNPDGIRNVSRMAGQLLNDKTDNSIRFAY